MTYEEFLSEWNNSSDSIVCQTSGSTGKPTLIEIPKIQMEASALRTCSFFGINSRSHLYSCISPDFIGGKMMMVRSIVSNASFSFETPSNHPFQDYRGSKIDLVSVVPSQMLYIVENIEKRPPIDCFLIGGAPLSDELREKITQNNINAYESYGMTETSSHIALRKVGKNGNCFKTLPGVTVFNYNGNLLGIEIAGWKEFLTNDIAELKSPHEFLILGRADNIINTGGKKVSPEIMESRLAPFLKAPFYITSRKDLKWGEHVVLATTDRLMSDSEIEAICRSILQPHEAPKEIIRIDRLPLTENGKIKRKSLTERGFK